MRRGWVGLGLLVVALPGGAFGAAYWSVSHPSVQELPLPADQIGLDSPGGRVLLARAAARADYDALHGAFQAQEKTSWCGVASSATVLGAMGHPIRQDDWFDRAPRSWLRTTFGGMPIAALAEGLRAHGVTAEPVFAEDLTVDDFRRLASENLARSGDFLIVNYDRAAVGQEGGGHISPLAAFDAATDRFLLLDVAAYKYPPMWIAAEDLFAAMNTPDSESGRSRGFVTVR